MRATLVTFGLVLLAACDPDIAPGSYLCGPEQLCPEGQVCNGPDNVCVHATAALPFDCAGIDIPGDDEPATATDLGELSCVSLIRETRGCLPAGDTGDYFTFRVADGCTNVRVQASVVYPVAFQALGLQLAKLGDTPVTIDTPCAASRSTSEGDAVTCLEAPVASGTYAIGVIPAGSDCDRECAFNRYGLAVQVSTQ